MPAPSPAGGQQDHHRSEAQQTGKIPRVGFRPPQGKTLAPYILSFVGFFLIGLDFSCIDAGLVLRCDRWYGAASRIDGAHFFLLLLGPRFLWRAHITSSKQVVITDVGSAIFE